MSDSDEEGGDNLNYHVFNAKNDMSDPVFKLGMVFKDHNEVKEAVKVYSINHGKEIRLTKNKYSRITAVCKQGFLAGCMPFIGVDGCI